jgi:hypothetical protein
MLRGLAYARASANRHNETSRSCAQPGVHCLPQAVIAGTCSEVTDNNLSSAIVNAYFCAFTRQCQNNGGPATRKSDGPPRGQPQHGKGAQFINPVEEHLIGRVGEGVLTFNAEAGPVRLWGAVALCASLTLTCRSSERKHC